jgi:hypothetical protein
MFQDVEELDIMAQIEQLEKTEEDEAKEVSGRVGLSQARALDDFPEAQPVETLENLMSVDTKRTPRNQSPSSNKREALPVAPSR